MKTIKEINQWLLENAVDTKGDLKLIGLDFSDFDGNVYICNMKVKKNLFQNGQKVGEDLHQDFQKVGESLWQDYQNVDGNLYQKYQNVGGDLYQHFQRVGKNFYNHKLNEDEYWEEKRDYVVRKKKLQKITRKQLAEMGYELEDEK